MYTPESAKAVADATPFSMRRPDRLRCHVPVAVIVRDPAVVSVLMNVVSVVPVVICRKVGDRYGRRLPMLTSCFVFGCATLAMLVATSLAQLAACRFVVGVGLGVALSTAIAIAADFALKKIRSRILALVSTCVPCGAILPGVLTAALVPAYGWRLLVIVGGGLPVLLAIVLTLKMPESPRYQALRPEFHARLSALLERLDAGLQWVPGPAGLRDERARSVSPSRLFGDGLAAITVSMWVLFFVNAMALYLVISWLPLVLQSLGMSIQQAGQTTAMFSAA